MSGAKAIQNSAAVQDVVNEHNQDVAPPKRSVLRNWLLQDSPYIAMLLLALIGVVFHSPPSYWVVLTPLFGIICIAAGWRHFETKQGRLQLAYTQVLSWVALMFTIYVLYSNVAQGVLNAGSTSLALLTLLALGTFMAGLQARVWRICAVGAILLGAVPCMALLGQSVLIFALAILAIIVIGFLTWWLGQRRRAPGLTGDPPNGSGLTTRR